MADFLSCLVNEMQRYSAQSRPVFQLIISVQIVIRSRSTTILITISPVNISRTEAQSICFTYNWSPPPPPVPSLSRGMFLCCLSDPPPPPPHLPRIPSWDKRAERRPRTPTGKTTSYSRAH